ncbi:MAG: DNA helicase UvrD, partial [candidate division Zixibacteria bacterium]|nr:DNA helicase UvrD [candidate division Zixibacteria bacterium]
NLDGSFRYPSRFIFNVDKTMLAYTNELDDRLVYETNWNISYSERMLESTASELSFKPGDRIMHSIMGAGEVVDLDRDQAAYLIKFDDLKTPRKISFKAKLEPEIGDSL